MQKDAMKITDDDPLDPADAEIATALAALSPAAGAIDRDRLMFAAGLAAGTGHRGLGRSLWMWRGVAALLAIGLTTSLAWKRVPGGRAHSQYAEASLFKPEPSADHSRSLEYANTSPRRAVWTVSGTPRMTARWSTVEPLPSATSLANADYLTLRDAVLRWGVQVLPPAPLQEASARPATPLSIETLLDTPGEFDRRPTNSSFNRQSKGGSL